MANQAKPFGQIQWRITMPDGSSKGLVPEHASQNRLCNALHALFAELVSNVSSFLQRTWELGANDPRKLIHCAKVGMALSLVSLFYYMRPLYDGVGGYAIWAILTVVVVFEYTVGATLGKCVNRVIGTLLAGALGVGVHWIATQSGHKFEPIIVQVSVFLLASSATFSRFIPSIKERFDYGASIFILTFSMVSISGYRVEKLLEFSHHRLVTIAIGASICVLISMFFCPVWAGNELHNLIKNNMEKLSDSLEGCVSDYFRDDVKATNETSNKTSNGYKCVLNTKATEESLANLARWEPSHGGFRYGYPWEEYIKVGASLRSCAYCIEALNSSITSDTKVPDHLKKHFSNFCLQLSVNSSAVLKELSLSINTMTTSSKIDSMVEDMENAVQELRNSLASFSREPVDLTDSKTGEPEGKADPEATAVALVEIVPLVTITSLLMDVAARVKKTAERVNVLAKKAGFKVESKDEKTTMTIQDV